MTDSDSDAEAVLDAVEHTVLGPTTTPGDVTDVLDAAAEYGLRACVPPCYLDVATEHAPEVSVTTVIGFPHGQHATEAKVEEARIAWEAGAEEVDVVLNVGRLRAGEDEAIVGEIEEIVAAVPIPVKVIVETPLLRDDEEKRRAAELVAEADADYLKTATGFSDGGATVPDVELLAEYLPVKASGGIGSWEKAARMFDAGAERIGASSGDVIAREFLAEREGEDAVDVGGESDGGDGY